MSLSKLAWRVLLVCVLPLSACERAAPDAASKATSALDTASVSSPNSHQHELPGDTVTTLVVDTAAAEPRLEAVGTGFVLRMPTRMHDALQAKAPGFKSFRRGDYDIRHLMRLMERAVALFAVVGEFDGDGRKDAVVHGATDSATVLVVVLNRRSGPRAVEIPDGRGDLPARGLVSEYVEHYPPGTIRSPMEAKPLQLKNDAFGFGSEKGGVLYYYRNGRFVQYVMGD